MLVTLFCLYFGEKPAEKMDRGQHMSQRRGDFSILNENPTQCRPGLDRLCKPITEGGGDPDPLTNTSDLGLAEARSCTFKELFSKIKLNNSWAWRKDLSCL